MINMGYIYKPRKKLTTTNRRKGRGMPRGNAKPRPKVSIHTYDRARRKNMRPHTRPLNSGQTTIQRACPSNHPSNRRRKARPGMCTSACLHPHAQHHTAECQTARTRQGHAHTAAHTTHDTPTHNAPEQKYTHARGAGCQPEGGTHRSVHAAHNTSNA